MVRTVKFSIAAIVAAGALVATSTSMAAASIESTDRQSENADGNDAYVVVDITKATEASDGKIFYPTGNIDSDTLVVIPDNGGTLGGIPVEEVTAILDAGGTEALDKALVESQKLEIHGSLSNYLQDVIVPSAANMSFAAPPMGYSPIIEHTTARIGGPGSQVHYGFTVTAGSNQHACATGRGYYEGYNGSEMGVWSKMYGIGCAGGGNTSGASVPWGNVASHPAFQARSTTIHMAAGAWWF